jgi:hypothetical protein
MHEYIMQQRVDAHIHTFRHLHTHAHTHIQALLETKITRATLFGHVKVKERKSAIPEQEATNAFEPFDGLPVYVQGTGSFMGVTIRGDTYASPEWGVRVSCCAIDMSISDFARFGGGGKNSTDLVKLANPTEVRVFYIRHLSACFVCFGTWRNEY